MAVIDRLLTGKAGTMSDAIRTITPAQFAAFVDEWLEVTSWVTDLDGANGTGTELLEFIGHDDDEYILAIELDGLDNMVWSLARVSNGLADSHANGVVEYDNPQAALDAITDAA